MYKNCIKKILFPFFLIEKNDNDVLLPLSGRKLSCSQGVDFLFVETTRANNVIYGLDEADNTRILRIRRC